MIKVLGPCMVLPRRLLSKPGSVRYSGSCGLSPINSLMMIVSKLHVGPLDLRKARCVVDGRILRVLVPG